MSSSFVSTKGIFPNPVGDTAFVLGIPLLAVTLGLFAYFNPPYFYPILMLDLWLLGYHHVISTFTRIGFDVKSITEYKSFYTTLPLMVIGSVLLAVWVGGAGVVGSVYLYWQWYHYTRQSEGISKAYGMKLGGVAFLKNRYNRALFYSVPLTSFFYMLGEGPSHFLNTPIYALELPGAVRQILACYSVVAAALWLVLALRAWGKGEMSGLFVVYGGSHFFIYCVSYIAINDVDVSWLTINIWHNAQYIFFVWLFNRKRYSGGVDKERISVSYLSQPGRLLIYLGVCFTLSTVVYLAINGVLGEVIDDPLNSSWPLIIYASINFHHYIVDSKIWKLRKSAVSKHLLKT